MPPWVERVLDVCLAVFFTAAFAALTTIMVVGTIVLIRAML